MNYLNLYKAFLIKEIMRNKCIAAKEAINYVENFVTTKEGIEGFQSFRAARFKLHKEKEPEPIRKFITKLEDKLDPIIKLNESDFDPKMILIEK